MGPAKNSTQMIVHFLALHDLEGVKLTNRKHPTQTLNTFEKLPDMSTKATFCFLNKRVVYIVQSGLASASEIWTHMNNGHLTITCAQDWSIIQMTCVV
jgi:hypothetical protein